MDYVSFIRNTNKGFYSRLRINNIDHTFYSQDFKCAKKIQRNFFLINKIYPIGGNMKKQFNKTESAEYLGITRWTFTNWIEIGLVPAGYPVSPKSFSRLWTRATLDKVLINIEKMNLVRERKNG